MSEDKSAQGSVFENAVVSAQSLGPLDEIVMGLSVPHYRKIQILAGLEPSVLSSEVLQPLFVKMGLSVTRAELENFLAVEKNRFGRSNVTVVVPFAGNLTLANPQNVEDAISRVSRALSETEEEARGQGSGLAYCLCVNGAVNDKASSRIHEAAPNGTILGATKLVSLIDQFFSTYWHREFLAAHQYFFNVRREMIGDSIITESLPARMPTPESFLNAVSDDRYLELRVLRRRAVPEKRRGKVTLTEAIEEFSVTTIPKRSERLVVLFGDAGSGKSTAVRRIALELAESGIQEPRSATAPVLLRAVDIAEDCENLRQCVRRKILQVLGSEHEDGTADALMAEPHFVIIDALDEIADQEIRDRVLKLASSYAQECQGCKVLVTTREYAAIRESIALKPYAEMRLKNIDLPQATALVKRMRKDKSKVPTDAATDVLRRLQESHGISLSPLLVAVFVATSEDARQDVPANITELFKKFTELMLGRWDEAKGFSLQYQAPLKDYVLQDVAFRMHTARVRSIPLAEFQAQVSEFLSARGLTADIVQLLDEITYRSGLLRIVNNEIEFRHHLIQEFFAGRGIANSGFIQDNISDEWWRNSIVFYFGENPGAADLLLNAMSKAGAFSDLDLHDAAVTLGQAAQASYLVGLEEKRATFQQVVKALSETSDSFRKTVDPGSKIPILSMVSEYFVAKDAVALSALTHFAGDLFARLDDEGNDDLTQLQQFWILTGLVQARQYDRVAELLKQFKPKHGELWCALDLACFLQITQAQFIADHDRRTLEKLKDTTGTKIAPWVDKILSEVQTQFQDAQHSFPKLMGG
jgi:predicted kinase